MPVTLLVSATVSCTSPKTVPGGLQSDTPITLGFTGSKVLDAAATITADLICSSSGSVAMALGSNYSSEDFAPNSPTVTITATQAAAALAACSDNTFYVQYTSTVLLLNQVAKCNGNFSIQAPETTDAVPSPASSPSVTSAVSPSIATSPTVTPTTSPSPAITATPPLSSPTETSTTFSTATPSPSSETGGGGVDAPISDPTPPAPSPSPSGAPSAADLQQQQSELQSSNSSSAPSIKTVAIASGSVLGGIFVVLVGMLIWRKRQQREESFDHMFGNSSLAAASGFGSSGTRSGSSAGFTGSSASLLPSSQPQAIYARDDGYAEKDYYHQNAISVVASPRPAPSPIPSPAQVHAQAYVVGYSGPAY
ncbi:hypothetical protein BGZ99_006836 [Dissophora globulifera]|uniref:Uncharacterized protein n=1 Tax=Dissophora globulifera TaxID=979702 RepID=A0A9P6RF94_9FUNG|nr:hypothetical protein BGZ99_006836 [Dissophora globulifera]